MSPPPRSMFDTILILGYGNLGQALSPLLRAWLPHARVHAIDERLDPLQASIASAYSISTSRLRVSQDNYRCVLGGLRPGALVLNLATSIRSRDLMAWAQNHGVFYLDTSLDPWSYQDGPAGALHNSNHALREAVLDLQRAQRSSCATFPTAVAAHGANPGFVSILVKKALETMRQARAPELPAALGAAGWARLARDLGIRCVQISEADHQDGPVELERGAFANTWSVEGFATEALLPSELGWGSHEDAGPLSSWPRRHPSGAPSSVQLPTLGLRAPVRSWTPGAGDFTGLMITHNESLSIASYLSLPARGSEPAYGPTCYYAYQPCPQAQASLSLLEPGHRGLIKKSLVLKSELASGADELGVLLLSDRHPSLWLGSALTIDGARRMAPHNNATSLQVVGSAMAALKWIAQNPSRGIVESDDLDYEFIYEAALPYWEPMVCEFRAWHPLGDLSPRAPWTLDQFLVS